MAAETRFDRGPQERESIDILVFRRIDNESQFRDLKYLERFWPQSKTEARGLSEFFNRGCFDGEVKLPAVHPAEVQVFAFHQIFPCGKT